MTAGSAKAKAKAARAAVRKHPKQDDDAFGAFLGALKEVVTNHAAHVPELDIAFETSGRRGARAVSIWFAELGRNMRVRRRRRKG